MQKILVIDDEDKIRKMLRKLVESEGYVISDAPDGNKGILEHKKFNADSVILDIFMPEKDGLETIVELKRDFPDIKIIAMSGGGSFNPQNYLKTASKCGAEHTFEKPIRKHELLQIIRQILPNEAKKQ